MTHMALVPYSTVMMPMVVDSLHSANHSPYSWQISYSRKREHFMSSTSKNILRTSAASSLDPSELPSVSSITLSRQVLKASVQSQSISRYG